MIALQTTGVVNGLAIIEFATIITTHLARLQLVIRGFGERNRVS